jgi:four helix bundle protein
MYGLTSQLRRAAVSVVTNFTEGFRRRSKSEKARFYNISHASLDEATYCLILAGDLRYGECQCLIDAAEEIGRMLESYTRGMLTAGKGISRHISGPY